MVYLYYTSCLRYTILAGNPRYALETVLCSWWWWWLLAIYQQHASASQRWIWSDNCTCCHTEIEAADQTCNLTLSEYTDTEPTGQSADPITAGAWQGSSLEHPFLSHWCDLTRKKHHRMSRVRSPVCCSLDGCLTTRPPKWWMVADCKKRKEKKEKINYLQNCILFLITMSL